MAELIKRYCRVAEGRGYFGRPYLHFPIQNTRTHVGCVGIRCLYLPFSSQNTCRSHKIRQKKAHSSSLKPKQFVSHLKKTCWTCSLRCAETAEGVKQSETNRGLSQSVKQVKIPGIQHQGGTLPSFCEKVVSAPAPKITRKAPIAEGRGLLEVGLLQYSTWYCGCDPLQSSRCPPPRCAGQAGGHVPGTAYSGLRPSVAGEVYTVA